MSLTAQGSIVILLQDESSPYQRTILLLFLAGAKGTVGAESERMSHKQDPQKYSINATDGKEDLCEANEPIRLPLERD